VDHAYSSRNFDQHYVVELATRPYQIREAKHFRYEVFCRERGIFSGDAESAIETDEYDANAHHVILREAKTGTIIGTTRLVLAHRHAPHRPFPMQRVCGPLLFTNVPISTTAEISRFALSKRHRPQSSRHEPLLRLALVRGIVQASFELGLTHWCAALETSLLRLLGVTGIHLTPIGPLVEYHGMRQPVLGNIEAVLARGRRECPAFYDFVTQEGDVRRDRPARLHATEGMRAFG
jgi:N-acyl-L-homoserine lactone synthetase